MGKIIPMAAFSRKQDEQPSRKVSNAQCEILLFDGIRYEPIPEKDDRQGGHRAGKGKRRRA
ncbi:hypothetical protein [Notoacmeibacter ruber]|uniref:Uncharacterized protein n=1 Tax=Notoacmeibacter ruber TaxID=2670375 RepID=A0A3L7JAX3_9HYPH|nr:hypothetical protein [Notoacmeibacter ruber]RLQ87525.1 hypothetical protein D8780_04190 [Notoacmeibacter ruber]